MWSEEEMREVEPEPVLRQYGSRCAPLRHDLGRLNLDRASVLPHELTLGSSPSVIYTPSSGTHGNFIDLSYRRICANPLWKTRLAKAHTAKRQAQRTGPDEEKRAWCELDSANSSDALLMNIFCYPRVLSRPRLLALLDVEGGAVPEFGYRPAAAKAGGLVDRTEIDLRLGKVLIEAKLTEAGFRDAPTHLVESYTAFREVFDCDALRDPRGIIRSYQLIRGVLAADAEAASFCLVCDARRDDLIEAWYAVLCAVRSYELRARLRLVTWQEIAATLPRPLRVFLAAKYGIQRPSGRL